MAPLADRVSLEVGDSADSLAASNGYSDNTDSRSEYEAAIHGAVILNAQSRGVIEVTGRDRATWLHNLTTNTVKTLPPGEGNYSFATSAKGRILFDCNILVLVDAIWLDIDRSLVGKALEHLSRYLITEDVGLKDLNTELGRILLAGPQVFAVASALGAPRAVEMAQLSSSRVELLGKPRLLVRHDSVGVPGLELYVDAAEMAACWSRLAEIGRSVRLTPVGPATIDALRIEAGIPMYGRDIDDSVLPGETMQMSRAVCTTKGCYLGQEVIERMRSHGSLARRLVGLRIESNECPATPASLLAEGSVAGRLTSCCRSSSAGGIIGLGYVKSGLGEPGVRLSLEGPRQVSAVVASLPFR